MINIPIPLTEVDERTIYNECADDLTDKTALGYIEKVVACASLYETYVPEDIGNFPEYEIEEGDDKKIKKVYTQKFVPKDSVGRKYYDAIMANAKGCCPICGGGKLKNLDHYLPKSKYPLLCVTPANLVPSCRDCNIDKSDITDTDYYSIPFNPYFDHMDEKLLECEIEFKSDNTFEIVFLNGVDRESQPNLWKKFETHLKAHDLNATFTSNAIVEINTSKLRYQRLYRTCGVETVREDLIEQKNSSEDYDINSWKAALYRELARKLEAFCEWLE